jgi:hypothetical protein
MRTRRAALRRYLSETGGEGKRVLLSVALMLIVPSIAFQLFPMVVPTGYFERSMQIAAACVMVAGISFGLLLESPSRISLLSYCVQVVLMQLAGVIAIYGGLWLVNEAELAPRSYFIIIGMCSIFFGTLIKVCWPEPQWWRGLWGSIRSPQYW